MKLPSGSSTIEEAVSKLAKRYDTISRFVLSEIDELAKSGMADQRWCAIARTDIEKGFLSLRNALPDARDGREYGKVPRTAESQNPTSFTPPVDPEGDRIGHHGTPPRIDWKDFKVGGDAGD